MWSRENKCEVRWVQGGDGETLLNDTTSGGQIIQGNKQTLKHCGVVLLIDPPFLSCSATQQKIYLVLENMSKKKGNDTLKV